MKVSNKILQQLTKLSEKEWKDLKLVMDTLFSLQHLVEINEFYIKEDIIEKIKNKELHTYDYIEIVED